MNKDEIIEAVIAIGSALQLNKWRQDADKVRLDSRETAVEVGHPVGTKLFSFCCDDGIELVEVVNARKVQVEGRDARFCTKDDRFGKTVDEAIAMEIERWNSIGELDVDENIKHFEFNVMWHKQRLEGFVKALELIKALKST